jgi:hypothetical protein
MGHLPNGWSWVVCSQPQGVPNVGDSIAATLQDPSGNTSLVRGLVTAVSNVQYYATPDSMTQGGGPPQASGESATVTFAAMSPVPGPVAGQFLISLGDEFQLDNSYVAPAPAPGVLPDSYIGPPNPGPNFGVGEIPPSGYGPQVGPILPTLPFPHTPPPPHVTHGPVKHAGPARKVMKASPHRVVAGVVFEQRDGPMSGRYY